MDCSGELTHPVSGINALTEVLDYVKNLESINAAYKETLVLVMCNLILYQKNMGRVIETDPVDMSLLREDIVKNFHRYSILINSGRLDVVSIMSDGSARTIYDFPTPEEKE